jgi:vacuolar protein 8
VIAKAGGAEPLVRLLRNKQATARAYALWSLSLSIDSESQKVVADEGGIKPLVALLNAKDSIVCEQSACAIKRLALDNKETQAMITKHGAVEPLIALLDGDGSDRSQEYAAAALSELALILPGKLAIDRGGGIQPLVALLSDSERHPDSKQYAAAALARLSGACTLEHTIATPHIPTLTKPGRGCIFSSCMITEM